MNSQMHRIAKTSPEPSFTPVLAGLIQRKQRGKHEFDKDCPKCGKGLLNLQRSRTNIAAQPTTEQPHFSHDFSKVRVYPKHYFPLTFPPTIQMKPLINQPGDEYEQEADRIADQVVSMSALSPVARAVSQIASSRKLFRKELRPQDHFDSLSPSEEESPTFEQEPKLQRSSNSEPIAVPTNFEHSLQQKILSGGEAFHQGTRTFMESRFGRDFAGVRTHRDSKADELASGVNARAFTVGNNIFFASSAYQPDSAEGQRLIAHELTHVLQQDMSNKTAPMRIQRQPAGGSPCFSYKGYNKSINVETYNCAGLALRNYQFISPSSKVVETIVNTYPSGQSVSCGDSCGSGKIKFWLWEYDLHLEDDKGTKLTQPSRDFHIVAGVTDQNGKDPTDVYSKNGKRPVEGPGTGPGFRPLPRDRALSNDASAQPATLQGRPVFKLRYNFTESCFCAKCS